MSKVDNPHIVSILNFVQTIYQPVPKALLFWDTCALLDILRLPYRNGSVESFRILNKIRVLIQSDELFSVASSLTIKEFNEHEGTIIAETQKSLELTDQYHSTCIDIANDVYGATYISEPSRNKGLVNVFEGLADTILSKTYFIDTPEVANLALNRIADKLPPASKKNEFKDCVIWETILKLSRDINPIDAQNNQIFFTVNTADFFDKGRTPMHFYNHLLAEAAMSNLVCCSTLSEVDSKL
ncbi:MAG: hypothetical protein BGO31_12745 [Bacteroidetes bacterium 43-16]|nr:MAG: hypothetical protein BGO31_12745 [Bacteroidetes bacterium 43-16]